MALSVLSVRILGLVATAAALPALATAQNVSITLQVTPAAPAAGQRVEITATVSPEPRSAAKITFYDGTTILGVANLLAGKATIASTQLASGAHAVRARLIGDGNVNSAVAAPLSFSVTPRKSYGLVPASKPIDLYDATSSETGTIRDGQALVAADFDRDGILDLAVASFYAGRVTFFRGLGAGKFALAGRPTAVGAGPIAIATADFNGDGNPDIAVANALDNTVSVLLGVGDGLFLPAPDSPFALPQGSAPYSMVAGDFNNDGRADLTVSGQKDVIVLLGDGRGWLAVLPGVEFDAGVGRSSVAIGDFNLDGNPDLAVSVQRHNVLTILLGDGLGGFSRSIVPLPETVAEFSYAQGQATLAVGDFDHDGLPDVATLEPAVTILRGDGAGGFSVLRGSPFDLGVSRRALSMTAADFDGDGNLDLAIGLESLRLGGIESTPPTLTLVLLGDGVGGFARASWPSHAVNAVSTGLAAGDFTGDGRVGVAYLSSQNGFVFGPLASLYVFLGQSGLSVKAASTPGFQSIGGDRNAVLQVLNRAPDAVSGAVSVIMALPPGAIPKTASGTGWDCEIAGQDLTCRRAGGVAGGAMLPEILLTITMSGAVCGKLFTTSGDTLLNAEVRLNDVPADVYHAEPASALTGCLLISLERAKPPVATSSAEYVVRIRRAEGAPEYAGSVQFTVIAAGLNSTAATANGWACTAAGPFLRCSLFPDPRRPEYPPVTLTGVPDSFACPALTVQGSVTAAQTIQDQFFFNDDLFGCIGISPSLTVDFHIVPFGRVSDTQITITSRDTHGVRLSWEKGTFGSSPTSEGCSQADQYAFGAGCVVRISFDSCSDPPLRTLVLKATSGDGNTATYPFIVRGSAAPQAVDIRVTGASGRQVDPAHSYEVAVQPTPAPADNCPRNTPPELIFSFVADSLANNKFDAKYQPETRLLDSGTVAGTITLEARRDGEPLLLLNGTALAPVTVQVPRQKGVVERFSLKDLSDSSFHVTVAGFSTPREASDTEVCLEFLPAAGAVLGPVTPFCALKEDIRIWYERPMSFSTGSRFQGDISVGFTGDKAAIGGLKAYIRNIVGDSSPSCIEFPSGKERTCP